MIGRTSYTELELLVNAGASEARRPRHRRGAELRLTAPAHSPQARGTHGAGDGRGAGSSRRARRAQAGRRRALDAFPVKPPPQLSAWPCRERVIRSAFTPSPSIKGAVPAYLRRRQQEWAEDAAATAEREARAAECPEGLRIVGEEEKASILRTLAQERGKADEELRSLPFVVKTQRTQQARVLDNRRDTFRYHLTSRSRRRNLAMRLCRRRTGSRRASPRSTAQSRRTPSPRCSSRQMHEGEKPSCTIRRQDQE